MGLVAAAGKPPEEIRINGVRFEELHRGGWDPRRASPTRTATASAPRSSTRRWAWCSATTPTSTYKRACFEAYNRWIADYCSPSPTRLLGCGQIADAHAGGGHRRPARDQGAGPARGDDARPSRRRARLRLPDLRTRSGRRRSSSVCRCRSTSSPRRRRTRGPKHDQLPVDRPRQPGHHGDARLRRRVRAPPELKVVCVEADAGWVPHYMYRMDHAYKRHRYWLAPGVNLERLPSEYFAENIYITFQDDWVAFKMAERDELAPADVGERLPAQRLHVAVVAGDARRAHQPADRRAEAGDPLRQRRRAVRHRPRRAEGAA